jgi:hypothetical protein
MPRSEHGRRARAVHLGVGALAVAALYVAFVSHSPGAVLYSDSMEYLGAARTLVGAGQPINFDLSASTASGYSILLAPVYLVTTDPHAVFLFALALNVLVGVSIFVAAYLLARDLFRLSHRWSLFSGVLAAVYPGYLLQSGQVWPEVLLAAEVLWWLVLLTRFLDGGGLVAAAGVGLVTGFAWTTHRRMAALVLVTLVALAFVGWRRRDRRAGALGAGSAILIVVGLTSILERWLREKLWTVPPVNQNGSGKLLAGLAPAHWGSVALEALGELWYLAAGSVCLVLLGAIGLSLCVFDRRGRLASADTQALVGLTALVAALGTLLIGALSLYRSPTVRVDLLVYGRYVEEFSGAMIVAAVAALVSTKPTTRRNLAVLLVPLVCLVASAAALYEIRGRLAFLGAVQKLTIPAILGEQAILQGRTVNTGAIHTRPITVVAAAVFVAILLLRRRSTGRALAAAATAFVVFAIAGETLSLHPFASFWNDVYRCSPTAIEDGYGKSGTIAMDLNGFDPEARNRYQFLLPGYRFTYFNGVSQRPPAELVIALANWPQGTALHFRPVTAETYGGETLWVSPSASDPPAPPVLPSGKRCPAAASAG